MRERYATVLVGFGSVAVGIGRDPKMAQFIRYPSHASVLRDHPRFDWQAVVEPRSEARKHAQEEWQVPIVVASVEQLPSDFKPDVVVLATRPDVRLSVLKALPTLKGALIEKPVAVSFTEGRAVSDYCAQQKLAVNINLFRRGEASSRELKDGRLHDLIGEIQTAFVLYGNGLRNNGLHMIDLLRMLGGEIAAVRALSDMRAARSSVAGDGEGPIFLKLVSGANVFLQALDFDCFRDVSIDIWGRKGRLEIFQEGLFLRHSPLREHRAIDGSMEAAIDAAITEPTKCGVAYYEMYSNLANVLDGRAELYCPPAEALRSEAVVEAAFLSARQNGRSVRIDEVWGQG